jgi:hypothetical protein
LLGEGFDDPFLRLKMRDRLRERAKDGGGGA